MNIENIVADKTERIYPISMQGLGINAIRLRESKGWSQEDLAKKAKVNVETIVRIEHDANVTISKLAKVAVALDATVGDLLPEDQWPKAAKRQSVVDSRKFETHQEVTQRLLQSGWHHAADLMIQVMQDIFSAVPTGVQDSGKSSTEVQNSPPIKFSGGTVGSSHPLRGEPPTITPRTKGRRRRKIDNSLPRGD